LKVNVAENVKMAEHFKIEKWPTDVIVTPDGRELFRSVSQQDPHRFVATLHQVAAHESVGLPVHGYAATPAPPPQSSGQDINVFPTPGTAPATPPQNTAPSNSRPPAAAAANPTMIQNQFAGPLEQNQPTREAPLAPAYGGEFQIPGAASAPPTDQTTVQPAGPSAKPTPPPADAKSPASPEVAPPSPQPPSEYGPPALDGFCAVSLLDQEKWVPGDVRWGVLHGGRLYLFASQEFATKFHQNHSKYAPALSGYDPVKLLEEGAMVDGKRAHGIFFHNQIVLFESEETLQKFWQSPARYAPALRANGQ
jgi:protein disulfide-isomerase